MRTERARALAPAVLGLLLGVLALGPALGPGFVLRYDMVFVPDPPLTLPGQGFPRAVPSDLVVALLSAVLPEQAVQKAILLGVFVLAASGAAALVPSDRLGPRLAAAAFYAWNAYLAQRLLLGQWALLLGVAGLPWAVRAAALGGRLRLVAALLPAAAGGFQAMLVSVPAVLATAATAPLPAPLPAARVRRVGEAALILGGLSLPWLVPALLSAATTDPAGVDAFAARADGPFGVLGSLLGLGGIWNAHATVPGQDSWWSAGVRLVLAAVAVRGFVRLRAGARGAPPYWTGLAAAAGAGLAVACLGPFAPGPLKALIGWWPGFGPLRDGQLHLASFALLQAVGLGGVAAGPVPGPGAGPAPSAGGPASRAVAAVAVAVPVLVLPSFALGAFGRLAAVDYPDEWRRVQAIVNADPAPGALLSLPWGAHRAFGWNGGRVILDPASKMFARRTVWNDELLVGLPDGGRITVAAEDPLVTEVETALEGRPEDRVRALAALGVRYVLVHSGDNAFHGGATVFQGEELRLLRLGHPR
ncbi:hypothetical protein [Planomonospora venezuelensis]|uniref:Uncharacterized protein n=1 Tax=Planomonospora venezuelensis TaxID=1999 RepID=A0A841CXA3_PLAVE|nr:hypothetical protein [Planomonospora venezuelensis]MBB5962030.1 hypothetical protein [Planomonospora venezuelensis]GIN00130.1 hypothetical protein Pve01_17880 [Planomonospora venezuelensis]